MKMKEFLTKRGGASLAPPLDPPLLSIFNPSGFQKVHKNPVMLQYNTRWHVSEAISILQGHKIILLITNYFCCLNSPRHMVDLNYF